MSKQKYFKYKNKYLELKNIHGGMILEREQLYPNLTDLTDYYLPCEITHITTHLYSTSILQLNPDLDKKLNMEITPGLRGIGYNQDTYIQLINGITSRAYNIINGDVFQIDNFKKKRLFCASDECVYVSNRKEQYQKELLKQNLSSSEIDSLRKMIQDKIFKKGSMIERTLGYTLISGHVENKITLSLDDEFKKDDGITISGFEPGEREQSKGGNFISGPGSYSSKCPIFYIQGVNEFYLNILRKLNNCVLVELNCSFKVDGFRHIDEIMCFMPYGVGKFKIWFYGEFNKMNCGESPERIQILNIEREENLRKISQVMFNRSWEEVKDSFVFFTYSQIKQSIFNRVWIEQDDRCVCLFPEVYIGDRTIGQEIDKLSSYSNGSKPEIIYVNLQKQRKSNPHGGAHCLIKQRFKAI